MQIVFVGDILYEMSKPTLKYSIHKSTGVYFTEFLIFVFHTVHYKSK